MNVPSTLESCRVDCKGVRPTGRKYDSRQNAEPLVSSNKPKRGFMPQPKGTESLDLPRRVEAFYRGRLFSYIPSFFLPSSSLEIVLYSSCDVIQG